MKRFLIIAILFCLAGCAGARTALRIPSPEKLPVSVEPEKIRKLLSRGQELFNRQCASCHGEKGKGDGIAAYLLSPHPRDFSLGKFRLVSTLNHIPSDEDLFKTISRGMPGTVMPPWEHLPEDDRKALIYYIRYLTREGRIERLIASSKKRAREKAEAIADRQLTPGEKIQLPEKPPLSMEIIARGRRLFVARCAECHGIRGEGDGRTDLKDDEGYPIRPRNFVEGVFKGGSQPEDIAYRIIAGIPATPMPSYADVSPEELWSLVYYIQSLANPTSQALVEQKRREVVAKRIEGELTVDMDHEIWQKASTTYLSLMPLWWREERVKGVLVQALHNGRQIAVHMVWEDATKNAHVLDQDAFSDGAAVQFSLSDDPPFFAMGYWHDPVNIWNWKAWREGEAQKYTEMQVIQANMPDDLYPSAGFLGEDILYATAKDIENPVSEAHPKTSVEDLNAGGFGSLTSQDPDSQNVKGRGEWRDGFWDVVFIRALDSQFEGDINLVAGKNAAIAFAIWDGQYQDRDGQKAVTIWHQLILEE